jgi:hypothetical protein
MIYFFHHLIMDAFGFPVGRAGLLMSVFSITELVSWPSRRALSNKSSVTKPLLLLLGVS